MKARLNPFASVCWDVLSYQMSDQDRLDLLTRLEYLDFRASILGPEGHGKSTLLRTIQQLLKEQEIPTFSIQLRRGEVFSIIELVSLLFQDKRVLLIDGADLLPIWVWWFIKFLSHRWSGIIVTSHKRRLLPVLWQCRTDRVLLEHLLRKILGNTSQGIHHLAQRLFQEHHGNIREVFRSLYQYYSTQQCNGKELQYAPVK